MKEINAVEFKEQYINWLNKEIQVNQLNHYLEITSPFLDRYNDYLQVYAKVIDNNQIFLTDDSYIIDNLKMSGVDINSAKRKQLLQTFLNKYSVRLENDALVINSNFEHFPQKLLSLMQAMLNVDDMFMLSQNKIASIFLDDIKTYFDKNEIFYSENINLTGKSGFIHEYDFLFQKNKTKPERLCKALNNPSKSNFQSTMFMWNDTKEARNTDSQLIVLLNDERKIDSNIVDGFKNYNVNTVLWSQRDNLIKDLIA